MQKANSEEKAAKNKPKMDEAKLEKALKLCLALSKGCTDKYLSIGVVGGTARANWQEPAFGGEWLEKVVQEKKNAKKRKVD